jgi:hypothetical protein
MAEKEVRPVIDFGQMVPDELMAVGLTGVQIAGIVSGIGTVVAAAKALDAFVNSIPSFEENVMAKLTAIEQKLEQIYADLVGLQRASAFWNARQHIDMLLAPLIGASLAVDQWAAANKNAPNAASLRFEPVGTGLNEVASRNALIALASPSFFEQPIIAKPLGDAAAIQQARNLNLDPPSWAYWANSTPPVNEFGLTFDYRLGVPALITDIVLRLKVMVANDPGFASSGVYDNELSIYVNRLRWAAQKIEEGILTRPRGGSVVSRGRVVVGQDAGGRNIMGGQEYEAEIWAEAACLYTGALASHRVKGTFSGQTIFKGSYCPLYYQDINDYQCDTKASAERMIYELSLRDKFHHGSGFETVQAQARARLLHRIGLFEIHAMIDLLETVMDNNASVTRYPRYFDSMIYPHGADAVIQSFLNRSCLEVVNGYDEGGARIAIAPMDYGPYRARQKWTYDRVNGQIRSEVGTCLAVSWNHYDNYGTVYWTASRYDSAITRGVRVTTAYGIAAPEKPYFGPPNFAYDAQRWTFNPRTGLLRNALGGGTLVLDVMWGNPQPGTPVWLWEVNGSAAQRWHAHRRSNLLLTEIYIRTRSYDYFGKLKEELQLDLQRFPAGHREAEASFAAGPAWERVPVIDLREILEEIQFPLRLPLEPTSSSDYVLLHEDGRLEEVRARDTVGQPQPCRPPNQRSLIGKTSAA